MSAMSNNGMQSSSYDQMNGADLLNSNGTEDILALLSNSNFEQPFDFGMLYSSDGGPGANGMSVNGDNGMFGTPSPLGFGSGSGPGVGQGGGYDTKDRNGQNFKMGTV